MEPTVARPPAPPGPRAAATLIVLRDLPDAPGFQVLLLRRAEKAGDQNSGAAVFPGGLLDATDRGHYARCAGLDDATASRLLGLPHDGLHHVVAAVRECFEEAGLLHAVDADGRAVDLNAIPAAERWRLRHALHANEIGMDAVCETLGRAVGSEVRLAVGELAYWSHWVTPAGMPKIFDTRFFVVRAPSGQEATHDATETTEVLWLTPAEALDKARGLKLMNVTTRTLQELATFDRVEAVLEAARARREVPVTRPRLGRSAAGRAVVGAEHPAFAEVGRLDPEGRGDVLVEPAAGNPVWLSPRVQRVIAPNGSLMTGPGTNAYFVGVAGADDWALIDPGPADDGHVAALLAAAPGRITRVLVTHTHKDHSPAVAAIVKATGARTYGRIADHAEWQDTDFVPDQQLADGDRIEIGPGVTLRVIHTPGHASNHLCYLLEEEKLLFTGDHLMQGSTVVINPPDGHMATYLRSLERLLDEDLEWLAPGHGFLIEKPHDVVRHTVAHRRKREQLVLADARAHGPTGEEAMVTRVYAGTPKALHAMALRSLRAHLQKLEEEGVLTRDDDGRWQSA